MEVQRTPQGTPEDRGLTDSRLDLTPQNRHSVRSAAERFEQGREARNRELQTEAERAERTREVARRVGEVVRDGMLSRPATSDQLELSATGLAAAEATTTLETGAVEGKEHSAHIAALKAALEKGELFSRERLERAADRLLGAEQPI
ncbi:MAG: hypothetical protein ACI841_001353 [Planctomycetota bacterium]|jgi:hypothetical protein